MSVCERVDLPDPFGPITACTSPLLIASETPLRICRPSTLACRFLISKSANSLLLIGWAPCARPALLHHVSAVVGSLGHPRRACHLGAQEPFVHLLLVDARQPRAGRDILDGAVAVTDRKSSIAQVDHLGHVTMLAREPGQLAHSRFKV